MPVLKQCRKIVSYGRRVGMVGAKRLLSNRQRALNKRPRGGEIALGLQQVRKIVEARRRVRMVEAERLLPDSQRALKNGRAVVRSPRA